MGTVTSNNVDFVARCLAASVKKAISDQLGDTSIKIISKEEYDSIVHDENTIYYVRDGDKIVQYVGDTKIGTGSQSGGIVYISRSIPSFIGNVEEVTE